MLDFSSILTLTLKISDSKIIRLSVYYAGYDLVIRIFFSTNMFIYFSCRGFSLFYMNKNRNDAFLFSISMESTAPNLNNLTFFTLLQIYKITAIFTRIYLNNLCLDLLSLAKIDSI